MSTADQDELLRYYAKEQTYLRKMGAAFAGQHPQVASHLELGSHPSPDPHVERLLEGFAFLTGRVQYNIDRQYPEIATELLNVLYPHYLDPVPSMAIARFEADRDGGLTGAFEVPRETPVFAQVDDETVCRFRTCYPLTLWPLEVTGAELLSTVDFELPGPPRSLLRLRIEAFQGVSLAALEGFDRLRFFLNAEPILSGRLLDLLHGARTLYLAPEGGPERIVLRDALCPVGFGPGEGVLPQVPQAHAAFRLLQEYFTFPAQFLFVDVVGLDAHRSNRRFDLLIPLDLDPRRVLYVQASTFALGCTPIINLFTKTTEPIRLDHRKTEYVLIPDVRHEHHTEIHSILSVSSVPDPTAASSAARVYEPYYSFHHGLQEPEHRAFWHARRRPSTRQDSLGSDVVLSLLDLDFELTTPAVATIYAQTLCTNRRLAERLWAGYPLHCDRAVPARIVCLGKPTPQLSPPTDGATLWRLISHLSVNYLSFDAGESRPGEPASPSLLALREMLRLYAFSDRPTIERQIDGIVGMSTRKVVRRMGENPWRGFCRGTEVTLVLDENAFVGASATLFATVLHRFFALYVSLNSFTELVVRRSRQPDQEWKRWPPIAGEQNVL